MIKKCSKCKKVKSAKDFYLIKRDGRDSRCKLCICRKLKDWRINNRIRYRETQREAQRKIRQEVLIKYGGKCKCCGEKEIKFLSIDHVNNDGWVERRKGKRKGTGMYSYLRNRKILKKYQLLCHNCNLAKGFYGKCPHL